MSSAAVKDTVHRYIEFDDFESRVIGTPWFQRLRRVKQNDVSSAVYPTMQATRFEHSLGAMHLAGACMKGALDVELPKERVHVTKFLGALRSELQGLPYSLADDQAASTFYTPGAPVRPLA